MFLCKLFKKIQCTCFVKHLLAADSIILILKILLTLKILENMSISCAFSSFGTYVLFYCNAFHILKVLKWNKALVRSVYRKFFFFPPEKLKKECMHWVLHGTIMRTGIACKKIPCYMRESACMWFIVKKEKIFWSYVKHFWIFAGVRKCRILIGLYKQTFLNCVRASFFFLPLRL